MRFQTVVFLLISIGMVKLSTAQQKINTQIITQKVIEKGIKEVDLGNYQGSLFLQGMAEFALINGDRDLLNRTIALYQKFGNNQIEGKGSFISYKAGGNGAAYLKYRNATKILDKQVALRAKQMFETQKRSKEGLLTAGWISEEKEQIFIDVAFAVTPYMLYAGLTENNSEYVDLAIYETTELFKILRDQETNLLHQGRGFPVLGKISEDNWSRGNGWGALAVATLVRDLPANYPKRKEVETLARDFFLSAIRYQNKDGLWHQEMTDKSSFVETSGSGLLLYGLGIMLEKGVLDKKYQSNFSKGIAALTAYVAADGGISNACFSCLCPRKGTKEDYINHVWVYNDPHAFGPMLLAFAQAIKLGITEINATQAQGSYAVLDTITQVAKTYVRYVPERSEDIAWENDRIAFRYYGPPVRDKVSSGIDVWAKSVDYSIIDKWYRLNARGLDYHVDRGEGSDFYHMGFLRGAGGTAIWKNNKPYPSETYGSHQIIKNDIDYIKFSLNFDSWDVKGTTVSEQKTISMVNGTNFFRVKSTIKSEGKDDLIIGIGLTTFGNPIIKKDAGKGLLSSWEKVDTTHGSLGTAVVVDPKQFEGFAQSGKDEYILIRVKPGKQYTYYVTAAWDGNKFFKEEKAWEKYLTISGWKNLKKIYADKK